MSLEIMHGVSHPQRTAGLLVFLMLLSSLSAVFNAPLVNAEPPLQVTEWPEAGSNDTGWILLEASGADSDMGVMATADLFQTFAPGAEISNLTFEIMVNGSQGVWADQPQLTFMDTQSPILDWRGNGDLGRQNSFAVGGDPHSGRLTPTSDTGASWVLPAGATIEDLVVEALRPVDPLVSFEKVDVSIQASAVHPDDGRLWLAVNDAFVTIDANNDPWIIDVEEEVDIVTMALDLVGNRLLLSKTDGNISVRDLDSGADLGDLPMIDMTSSHPKAGSLARAIAVDNAGIIWIAVDCALGNLAIGATSWNYVTSSFSQGQGPCEESSDSVVSPTSIFIQGTDVYVGTSGSGVLFWDGSSATNWNTQGPLTSDYIRGFVMTGNHLLIATTDAGIVRRDTATNSWLATWSSGNWLADNDIHAMVAQPGWIHIMAGDTVHTYDTSSLSFTSNDRISDIGLAIEGGDLIAWPAGGLRGPSNSTVLVSDGTGKLAQLEPESSPVLVANPIIASGPTSEEMLSVTKVGDIAWIGGIDWLDRFDFSTNLWLEPIATGTEGISITNDGSMVYLGSIDDGIFVYSLGGNQTDHWTESDGLSSDNVNALSYDAGTGKLVAGHPQSGFSVIDANNGTIDSHSSQSSDAISNFVTDVATRAGIVYIATENKGVMRFDLTSDTLLSSWNSLGADDLENAPIATDGSTVWLGLDGFGVLVYDRLTGEITDHWMARGNGGGGSASSIPSNNVRALHLDSNGGVIIGTAQGMARWDGQNIVQFNTGRPIWSSPREFNSITSTTTDIWAATNVGACRFDYSYNLDECFDSDDDLPSDYALEVDLIGVNTLYIGTYGGAAVFATNNDTVIDVWEAGEITDQAAIVVVGDVAYMGLKNVGITRYNLTTDEWMQTWDSSQGILRDNDVTALVKAPGMNEIWAGGEFGLTLIDVVNETVLKDWDQGSNQGGPTLSSVDPAEIVIMDDILYYSLVQSGWNSNDYIYRIDLNNETSSTIDAGQRIGTSGIVYGMGAVDDQIWIGVVPQQWWNGDGTVVRWNDTTSSWDDDLSNSGSIDRVNAQYIGDCFPLNITDCELWIAYGDNNLRRMHAQNGTLIDSWTDIEGPIRGIVEWQGEVLLASTAGVLRYNRTQGQWLTAWTEGSGLPQNSEDQIFAMRVIGDDLWLSSMDDASWNTNAKLLWKNGSTGSWTTKSLGSTGVPSGYGADILECAGTVHIAVGRTTGWGTQGGIARYNLSTGHWDSSWTTQGQNRLPNDDTVALACDEMHDIIYIGFNSDGQGISRYSYTQGSFFSRLTSQNGISEGSAFPGGMLHDNNVLLVGHIIDGGDGGFSLIGTNGAQLGNGQHLDRGIDACSIVRAPTVTGVPAYAIGRSGGTSGFSRVDWLDGNGLVAGGVDEYADLTSGRVVEIISNETHVWVVPAQGFNINTGTSILEGVKLQNGSVSWTRAFQFNQDIVSELMLDGTTLWVTTNGWGLVHIDLSTGVMTPLGMGFHWAHDGIMMYGNELIIGLMGTESTAAGLQRYDTSTYTFTGGRLLAGLPSNIVIDFVKHDGRIWVATVAGLGVWNLTRDDWDDPLTTLDGLPTPVIEHLIVQNNELWIGTGAGLTRFDTSNLTVIQTLTRADGLIGTKVSGFAYSSFTTITDPQGQVYSFGPTMFLAHDGSGITRPGITVLDPTTLMVTDTYPIDMIPSNRVMALAADSWGVHIATEAVPMVHWNASSGEIESGVSAAYLSGWPPIAMSSNGMELGIITQRGSDILSVQGTHQVLTSGSEVGLKAGHVGLNGIVLVGNYGMFAFGPAPAHAEYERVSMRRAEPLNVLFAGQNFDLTNSTRPGTLTTLASPDNSWTIGETGAAGPNGIPMLQQTLTMLSPIEGAATWVRTHHLNYSGTWDLAALDTTLESRLQMAISNAALSPDGRSAHIQMQSPSNGSMWVRLTYDWMRVEEPSELTEFYDRPNDGGGVLIAKWSPSTDAAWVAYRIYVWAVTNDRPDNWQPERADLGSMTYDLRTVSWTDTIAELTTAQGQSLVDRTAYRAAIVIEYAGSQVGIPVTFNLSAIPTDEIPAPPTWAAAGPADDGEDGDLFIEWTPCDEIDAAFTRIWATDFEITSALALRGGIDRPFDEVNSTTFSLETGRPYWIALVCVDQAGQFDALNATIVGPVVPTGGVDDGQAPMPVDNVSAADVEDDEGGRILVKWDQNGEDDCAWYTIYISLANDADITDVTEFEQAAIVPNCAEGEWIIDSIAGAPLIDGVVYRIAVVAADVWGNEDLWNVTIIEASSIADGTGGANPPDRVQGLEAWDHPSDDGSAIDVSWNPSSADDFGFYVVWVSEHPVDSVGPKWSACEDAPEDCGLMIIDRRAMSRNQPLEVTLRSALYGGDGLGGAVSELIRPGTTLHVTVSIHDVKGNAFLTRLADHSVLVTPVDNRGDITPPTRLDAPTLADRPNDAGDGLLVEFPLSTASDLDHYEIFADLMPFTTVGSRLPAMMIEDRSPELPINLTQLSDRRALAPGVMVWVAVVAVDTNGNMYTDELHTSNMAPIDDTQVDPGLHIPEVTGVTLEWNQGGKALEVKWDILADQIVRSYWIYISEKPFEDTRNATLAEAYLQGTRWLLTSVNESDIDNSTTWYVAVVAFDGEVHRFGVDSTAIGPYEPNGSGAPQSNEAAAWWQTNIGLDSIIIIILLAAIIGAVGVILGSKMRRRKLQPWEMATPNFGLPEENWGGDSFSEDADIAALPTTATPSAVTAPIVGGLVGMDAGKSRNVPMQPVTSYDYNRQTAQTVQSEYGLPNVDTLVHEARHHDTNQDNFLDATELRSAAEALRSGAPKADDIDMSFLDDLL